MREFIVEADGGSRGNPGPAGYGSVVIDAVTGETLVERAEYIGVATNNVAEYRGLIAGLLAARDLDPAARVRVRMDSKLVVEQMSGRWQIKHPDMRPLAAEAARVLPRSQVTYEWIPRAQNKHADRLANDAMDAGKRGEPWTPPAGEAASAEVPVGEAAGPAVPVEGRGERRDQPQRPGTGTVQGRGERRDQSQPGGTGTATEAPTPASGGEAASAGAPVEGRGELRDQPQPSGSRTATEPPTSASGGEAAGSGVPVEGRGELRGQPQPGGTGTATETPTPTPGGEAASAGVPVEGRGELRGQPQPGGTGTATETPTPPPGGEAAKSTDDRRAAHNVATTPTVGWGAPPDMGAPATFVLLRHGETPLTPQKRFSGSGGSDPSLSDVGRQQAERAARALAARGTIQAVVASPLARTRETAAVVAARLGLDVTVEDGLRETDFGAWEGLTFGEVRDRYPDDMNAWLGSPDVEPTGGGESFAATAHRMAETRDRLTAAYAGRTVLLVTHVTPIKTLVRLALGAPPESLFRMELSAASLSAVAYYADGNASVRLFNDTSHLR
ncbi:bifunctional RNase H/acid phosphatase [Streptomyces sp. M41(2017)]|uniref:bifunctional RNase H/acid phosphatase n=1 Tax=Streptomyces sp. M41(2017) TaxID=1955065 RepID=UPI0009C000AE|nr:bifunctional RNase H/acid phosphatase [Streptomyces sp. M41(2017)]OQQ16028.1 bifunctional RNase H/acid phosphatase [Streptomyces sp. M41(2017)]